MLTRREVDRILRQYEQSVLEKSGRMPFRVSTRWADHVPLDAGVYAFFEGNKIIYVGQTGSLKERMRDVRRTVNHTLRRHIGHREFAHRSDFRKATSKIKFPDTIERLVDGYMEKLNVTIVPIAFGRAEVEEHLIAKYEPSFNTKTKRGSGKVM